jgi:hypothetical protein
MLDDSVEEQVGMLPLGPPSFPIGPTTKHNCIFGASALLAMQICLPASCFGLILTQTSMGGDLGRDHSELSRAAPIRYSQTRFQNLLPATRRSSGAGPSRPNGSRRGVHLRRRQGLADRLGSEFGEYAPQGADAWRERITVVLDDVVELLGESGGFFVG